VRSSLAASRSDPRWFIAVSRAIAALGTATYLGLALAGTACSAALWWMRRHEAALVGRIRARSAMSVAIDLVSAATKDRTSNPWKLITPSGRALKLLLDGERIARGVLPNLVAQEPMDRCQRF